MCKSWPHPALSWASLWTNGLFISMNGSFSHGRRYISVFMAVFSLEWTSEEVNKDFSSSFHSRRELGA